MYNFDLYIKMKWFSLMSVTCDLDLDNRKKSTIFVWFEDLKVIFKLLVTTIGFADITIKISMT